MAGRLALCAEVLGRLDDSRAEELEPEAVDGHAGRQADGSGAISQLASPRRLTGAPGGSGGRNAGTPRSTFSPRWSYSPRLSRNAGLGAPAFSRKISVAGKLLLERFRDAA